MKRFMKLIKALLLLVMAASLVGSFILIFLGHYKAGFIFGGVFMFLATTLSQLLSHKNDVYVQGNIYENNRKKWH